MNIKFTNARILTMADEKSNIIKGELIVSDDKIKYVGTKFTEDMSFDRVIDCKGNVLMPGFKNAHTHTAMTFTRSYADNLPLQEWLYEKIFPMETKLDDEIVYNFSMLGFAEYIKSGITSCFDMYFYNDSFCQASVDAGFRSVLVDSTNDFGGMDIMEEQYLKFNDFDELVSYKIGFHAEYTTSMENMQKIAEMAEKYKSPIYVHNSETQREVDECIKRYGKTPTKLMYDLGMFKYGGGGFHCIYLTDEDIDIFVKNNLYAITNPCSNLKLASGMMNVKKMYDRNVNIAIGTDGAGSNNALNMFREMYLAAVLSKVINNDASAVDPYKILKSATTVGAHALQIPECDTLAVGKKADIIMLDMHQPNMQPINSITDNIVYSGDTSNVLLTMVNGKILYENGEFKTIDKEKLFSKCNSLMEKFK